MPTQKKSKTTRRILIKRKKRKVSDMQGKVYMPQKKSTVLPVRSKKTSFLKKFKFNRDNKKSFSRRRKLKFINLFLYIIIPLIFLGLLYVSVTFVLNMRGKGEVVDLDTEYVIGLDEIPSYPGSVFIFESNISEASVANFIGTGNSAYRLPPNTTIVKVYEYYKEALLDLGWEHVLSVEVGSEEMKEGEYWVKGNAGLRIYSKFNDIWYESLSFEQANSGLRERVEREIERDLLMAGQEYQDLLPDFAWLIKVPKEYMISYRTSNYEDFRLVEFRKIGSSESVSVVPIGRIGSVLDNYLQEYISILNAQNDEDSESLVWGIANTILSYTSYGSGLKGTITSNGVVNDVAVVQNSYDNVVYIIHANTQDDPFFEYVLSNMQPQGMQND